MLRVGPADHQNLTRYGVAEFAHPGEQSGRMPARQAVDGVGRRGAAEQVVGGRAATGLTGGLGHLGHDRLLTVPVRPGVVGRGGVEVPRIAIGPGDQGYPGRPDISEVPQYSVGHPSRDLLPERVMPADAHYVALPQPAASPLGHPGPGPFLEGGDVLVLGKHVFVGLSGMASNEIGYRWLAKYLRPFGFAVTPVRLPEHVLHLDCALSLVRDGLAIVCPDRLPDGLPAPLRDWETIEVSEDEAAAMATNGLPIDSATYITDPEFARVGAQLEARGITVEYIDFSVSRLFGGAFRCSTQPLLRA